MKLIAHVPGAEPWDVDDGLFCHTIGEAISEAASQTAADAGSDLLASPDQKERDAFRDAMVEDMTRALVRLGDRYRAPDGVLYTLDPS